jgi:aminotransferase
MAQGNALNSKLSKRIQQVHLPNFKDLAALALKYNAIDLGGGAPDFPTLSEFKEAAVAAIRADYNQYSASPGLMELREGIASRIQRTQQILFDPVREITICCGVTESMAAVLLSIIDPGDEVIIPVPSFMIYGPDVELCGGTPVYVELTQPGFRLEKAKLAAAISPKTKAIILNTPHNPTGRIFDKAELLLIAGLCEQYDLLLITDEIYSEIYFTPEAPQPIWTLPGMRARTIITSGFSKTYSVTGWRLGYVIAPPALSQGIGKAHNFLTLSAPMPLQLALVTAIQIADSYYEELRAAYRMRRDILIRCLQELQIPYLTPEGGYFLLADFSEFGEKADSNFVRYLTEKVGVSARPLSGFYPETTATDKIWVRIAFCKQETTLKEAARRLKKLRE